MLFVIHNNNCGGNILRKIIGTLNNNTFCLSGSYRQKKGGLPGGFARIGRGTGNFASQKL